MRRIFVVGSLRKGEYNHDRFAELSQGFLSTGTVAGFVLKDLGTYPAMIPSASQLDRVVGEIYEVSDDLGRALDRFESADGYFPRSVTVVDPSGTQIQAEAYCIAKPESVAHHRTVAGGDWTRRDQT